MNLIIVESPTKARTLSRFLGGDYKVEATMGHIKDLPKNKVSVDVENDFKPNYVVVAKREESIKKIKDGALHAKLIYIATDPDREGEAIAQHVKEILSEQATKRLSQKGKNTLITKSLNHSITRIVFHEITKEALEEALKNPRSINKNLVNAQIARRVLDRLVGYNLSPLLWKKVRRGLSAGRVQSVAVRLIVEREREIGAFKPVEYWEIFADVASSTPEVKGVHTSGVFVVQLIKVGEKKAEVKDGKTAKEIVDDLEKSKYNNFNYDTSWCKAIRVVCEKDNEYCTKTLRGRVNNLSQNRFCKFSIKCSCKSEGIY